MLAIPFNLQVRGWQLHSNFTQDVANSILSSSRRLAAPFTLKAVCLSMAGGLKVHSIFKQKVVKSIQSSDRTFASLFILQGINVYHNMS